MEGYKHKIISVSTSLFRELEPDYGNLQLNGDEAPPPGYKEMSEAKCALKDSDEHLKAE